MENKYIMNWLSQLDTNLENFKYFSLMLTMG